MRYFVGQYFFPQRGSRFEALQDVRLEEDHSGSTEPVERRPSPGDFDDVESLLAVCAESVGEEVEEEAGVFRHPREEVVVFPEKMDPHRCDAGQEFPSVVGAGKKRHPPFRDPRCDLKLAYIPRLAGGPDFARRDGHHRRPRPDVERVGEQARIRGNRFGVPGEPVEREGAVLSTLDREHVSFALEPKAHRRAPSRGCRQAHQDTTDPVGELEGATLIVRDPPQVEDTLVGRGTAGARIPVAHQLEREDMDTLTRDATSQLADDRARPVVGGGHLQPRVQEPRHGRLAAIVPAPPGRGQCSIPSLPGIPDGQAAEEKLGLIPLVLEVHHPTTEAGLQVFPPVHIRSGEHLIDRLPLHRPRQILRLPCGRAVRKADVFPVTVGDGLGCSPIPVGRIEGRHDENLVETVREDTLVIEVEHIPAFQAALEEAPLHGVVRPVCEPPLSFEEETRFHTRTGRDRIDPSRRERHVHAPQHHFPVPHRHTLPADGEGAVVLQNRLQAVGAGRLGLRRSGEATRDDPQQDQRYPQAPPRSGMMAGSSHGRPRMESYHVPNRRDGSGEIQEIGPRYEILLILRGFERI
ncbi:MAG: hypothetical protein DMF52_03625 [Acidobacteria bacterium]|nr:MAG: hypothetical protein DMF52_03625 [Acidobacteriota bacterium]